ncbi:AsmA family protein [Flavobacterium cerinum]|uniref:AsmA family protein n=1 Tax=Flavobacterium cerinum TaxID=2502784 RepID=A0A3S3TZN4_9FLAO|nr:AsmA-like C-terminal region-containing protein [Flavobacterium cerinum]RWW99587.1 AsmA family protein [Flavobacterium cerinum]
MKEKIKQLWAYFARPRKWLRITLRIILVFFALVIAAYVGLAWYINTHKKEVQANLLKELNGGLTGILTVGNMEPTFLKGFPQVSLRLEKIVLRDSLYQKHGHTLLTAEELNVTVNTLALIRGTIEIQKMNISNAAIDMFTTVDGYSNTAVFKEKKSQPESEGNGSFPQLRKLSLNNVSLAIDNRQRNKLFKFNVEELDGIIDYKWSDWTADVSLRTVVHSMAFNTQHGSFIKEKKIEGNFDISYTKNKGFIVFEPNNLDIGGEDFVIGAKFQVADNSSDFTINISNEKIMWRNAAHLLSANISSKLDMFALSQPISVKCDLIGDFNEEGDPFIHVLAKIRDNELNTPGGLVSQCNFDGEFTNNHVKGKGLNDANSAIKLFGFNGVYAGLPFEMKKIFILDLEKPIAVGNFTSTFDVAQLKNIIDKDLLTFSKGTADVKLDFTADIVDFKLAKPMIKGVVNVKNADVSYVPRKLDFKDVSLALTFTRDNLNISKIVLKSGKSLVNMEGNIENFLNLYYTDPHKIVLTWQIHSPQLHLGEFLGFLGSRQIAKTKRKKAKGNFTDEINDLFEKSNVDMKLRVDKLYYNRFLATNVKADILLTDAKIVLKNAGLQHGGGTLLLNGNLVPKGKLNQFNLDAVVNNVDINKFFYAFKNFGMETLQSKNLSGLVSSKADISGTITDAGVLVPKSIYGNVSFGVKKGKLLNFDPVRNVGKFAFPFRDMNTIEFYNLNGKFDIKGEKVTIWPMQINSSILNMDVQGIYSFGKGTQIYIDVPLRNPKKDKDIIDKEELAKRRNRGIVVHLTAEDDKDGNVKMKIGGKKD